MIFQWHNIKFKVKKYNAYYYTYPCDLIKIGKGNIRVSQREGITIQEAKSIAVEKLNEKGYKYTKACILMELLR